MFQPRQEFVCVCGEQREVSEMLEGHHLLLSGQMLKSTSRYHICREGHGLWAWGKIHENQDLGVETLGWNQVRWNGVNAEFSVGKAVWQIMGRQLQVAVRMRMREDKVGRVSKVTLVRGNVERSLPSEPGQLPKDFHLKSLWSSHKAIFGLTPGPGSRGRNWWVCPESRSWGFGSYKEWQFVSSAEKPPSNVSAIFTHQQEMLWGQKSQKTSLGGL